MITEIEDHMGQLKTSPYLWQWSIVRNREKRKADLKRRCTLIEIHEKAVLKAIDY